MLIKTFPAAADKEAEFWSKMKQLEVLPDLIWNDFNFKSFTRSATK